MRRLLSYEYLLEPIPGPPGPFRILYILLGITTLGSAILTCIAYVRSGSAQWRWALVTELALGTGAEVLLACAFRGVPLWSMRLLVFGAHGLAWLWPLVMYLRHWYRASVGDRHLQAFAGTFDLDQPPMPRRVFLLLLATHLAGTSALAAHYRWPLWFPVVLLACLLSPQLFASLRHRRRAVHLEGLAPLFLAYGILAARLLALVVMQFLGQRHFALPPSLQSVLSVDLAVAVAIPWSLLAQIYSIPSTRNRRQVLVPVAAAIALLLTLSWAAKTYLGLRTHGVTATDPYCYAQMAVDLVRHGVPVHAFPLVQRLEALGVSPEAGVHLGYHLPFDAAGRSATVWPIGQSVLLAAGFQLVGEEGLYLVTPALGLLSLVALAALCAELLKGWPRAERAVAITIAVLLLATSYAQVERLWVPMADAAAQVFSTLTILCWLRAMAGRRALGWSLLAGLSLAAAYWTRHTQLVLGIALLVLWSSQPDRRKRVAPLACLGAAALLAALPDLFYHRWVMGHWLRPESLELRHFSLQYFLPMAARAGRDLLSQREFLLVSPLLVYGLWRQCRHRPRHFAALATWLAAVLLIHLPYEALRLRDLLSLYPVLCFWAGLGAAALGQRLIDLSLLSAVPPFLRAYMCGVAIVGLLVARTGSTLRLAVATDANAFGRLNRFQRQSFQRIADQTESAALIGASLNSGAVALHSGRTAFRPAVWTRSEFYTFVDDSLARGEALYLLDDGLEMAATLSAARQRYDLQRSGLYDIPFYHIGGGSTGGRVALYRLHPQPGGVGSD